MADTDETDREAILERRRRFIEAGLGKLERPIGARTGAVVLAVATLATACPCLSISVPDDDATDPEPSTQDDEAGTDTTGTDGTTDSDAATTTAATTTG